LWILSMFSSTNNILSCNGALSLPIKLAVWIFSHLRPLDPSFFPYPNSNKPLTKSLPIWLKCGGIG
jgi:hypothetical protein